MLPIYQNFNLYKDKYHPGLIFDKFPSDWNDQNNWQKPFDSDAKKNFLSSFVCKNKDKYKYLQQGLDCYLQRQEKLILTITGLTEPPILHMKTDWRFVSGLGCGHPYETGFIWHRTLGVPYLPGSSIKGLMRAWVEQWCTDQERKEALRLFGNGDSDQSNASDEVGTLIVFDAIPISPPKLELDILNPHYGPYYQDNSKPPADYYSPVPVFFLTVAKNETFCFFLAPKPGAKTDNPKEDVKLGLKLLKEALKTLGIGGKTAVGYGLFSEDETAHPLSSPNGDALEKKFKNEIENLTEPKLIQYLSRDWNKTRNKYGENFNVYIKLVKKIWGEKIKAWKKSNASNKQKAYKKIYGNN